MLNNLPVDHMAETGEGPVVAVDVIRRLGEPGDAVEPPLPSITETLARATVLGSVERAERNRALALPRDRPGRADVGLRDVRPRRAVEAGRAAGRRCSQAAARDTIPRRRAAPV